MKIIFNAYNLILGGGLSVGHGVIDALFKLNPEYEIHVFLPRKKVYSFTSSQNIYIHFIPPFFTDYTLGRLLAGVFLSYKARRIKPDRVFSLGNYALAVSCPQLLMLQWPYAVYPEKMIWFRMKQEEYFKRKLRLFFLKKSLKYATALTVQTEVMKERVLKYLPDFKGEVFVVESSFDKTSKNETPIELARSLKEKPEEKLLLSLSEYYSHKNLEILVPLAQLIKEKNLNYKILITIDPSSGNGSRLLIQIRENKLERFIINLGRLNRIEVAQVYKSCDALLLPTLVESYGIPYLEAAYAGKPVITSDLDFAHAINRENAWYFNPLSPDNILQVIQDAFSDQEILKRKTESAFHNASQIPSWVEITKKYLLILKNL